MNEPTIHYLALDVHQATTVASVRDAQGRVVMRATVPTEGRALLDLIHGLRGRVEVAFEEGTQAQWLHDLLVAHAARVVVCNVRGRSEKANKNDQLDADDLSEQLRLGALKPVWHGSPAVGTLKELVRCYDNLVDDSTRVMRIADPSVGTVARSRIAPCSSRTVATVVAWWTSNATY